MFTPLKSATRTPGSRCTVSRKSPFSIPYSRRFLAPVCVHYEFWSLDGLAVFEHCYTPLPQALMQTLTFLSSVSKPVAKIADFAVWWFSKQQLALCMQQYGCQPTFCDTKMPHKFSPAWRATVITVGVRPPISHSKNLLFVILLAKPIIVNIAFVTYTVHTRCENSGICWQMFLPLVFTEPCFFCLTL